MSYLKNGQNKLTKHGCPVCPAKFALFKNYQKHILTHGVADLYRIPKVSIYDGFLQDRQWGAGSGSDTLSQSDHIGVEITNPNHGSTSSEQDITFNTNLTFVSGEDLIQSSDIVITQQPVPVYSPSENVASELCDSQANSDMIFVGLSCETVDDDHNTSSHNSEGLSRIRHDRHKKTSYLKNKLTKHVCPVCPAKFALLKNLQKHTLTHGVTDLYRIPKVSTFNGFLQDHRRGAGSSSANLSQSEHVGIEICESEQNKDTRFVGLSCETMDDYHNSQNSEGLTRGRDRCKKASSSMQNCYSDSDMVVTVLDVDSIDDVEILSEKATSDSEVSEHSSSTECVESFSKPSGKSAAASNHTLNPTHTGITNMKKRSNLNYHDYRWSHKRITNMKKRSYLNYRWSPGAKKSGSRNSKTLLDYLSEERHQNTSGNSSNTINSHANRAKVCAMEKIQTRNVSLKTGVIQEKVSPAIQSNTIHLKNIFEQAWKCYDSRTSSTVEEFEEISRLLSFSFLQRFRCKYCGLSFVNFDGYSKHMHSHRRRLLGCRNMKRKHLYERSFLPLTVFSKHRERRAIQSNVRICPNSGEGFTGAALEMHYNSKCSQRRQCQYCDKNFDTDEQVRDHECLHLSVTPYQCSVCGHGFALEKYFKMHMIMHSNIKGVQ